MPQFDSTFFESQVFWTIISFIVLFIALKRWVLPIIHQTLEKRTELIEHDMTMAKQARNEAEHLKNKYQAHLDDIHEHTKQMHAEAEEAIRKKRAFNLKALEEELQHRKEAYLKDEEAMRQQAQLELRHQASSLVIDATEQLIHHHYSQGEAKHELEDIIKKIDADLSQKP